MLGSHLESILKALQSIAVGDGSAGKGSKKVRQARICSLKDKKGLIRCKERTNTLVKSSTIFKLRIWGSC